MNHAPNSLLGFISSIAPIHGGFNAAAAADATQRVLAFLKRELWSLDWAASSSSCYPPYKYASL